MTKLAPSKKIVRWLVATGAMEDVKRDIRQEARQEVWQEARQEIWQEARQEGWQEATQTTARQLLKFLRSGHSLEEAEAKFAVAR